MNGMAVAIMMLQALPSWAHPGPSVSLVVAAPAPQRACVDRQGHEAECGEDPTVWHECYASDQYGRCPPDPKCFDATGAQVRCSLPVNFKVDRCPDGKAAPAWVGKPLCVGHRGVLQEMRR